MLMVHTNTLHSVIALFAAQTHFHTLLDTKTQILNHLSGAIVPALFVTHPLLAGQEGSTSKQKLRTRLTADIVLIKRSVHWCIN